jgi:serine/threonine protein kinase
MVASSGFARVAHNAARGIYFKQFLPRSATERLKALLRGSRATRARRHSDSLRDAGFDAPRNIAWGRLRGGSEYLFSSAVPGHGITAWLRQRLRARDPGSLRLRRRLLRQFGDFIGRLHAAGFVHGDLRPSNALADLEGEQFHFYLIDNERNRRALPPGRSGMLKNLMQLNMLLPADLTRSDRWRFFLAWRPHHPGLSDAEARALALEAWTWAMRRLRDKGKL